MRKAGAFWVRCSPEALLKPEAFEPRVVPETLGPALGQVRWRRASGKKVCTSHSQKRPADAFTFSNPKTAFFGFFLKTFVGNLKTLTEIMGISYNISPPRNAPR